MEREITIEETQESYRHVQRQLRLGNGTKQERQRVKQRLSELEDELSYVLGDQGFEEFVSERLTVYQRELDETKSMCSCWRSTCPLKKGEVPEGIRQHGTSLTGRRRPSELVAEWLQRHKGGEALALIRKEWARMVVRVHVALDNARTGLQESENIPSKEEMAKNAGLLPDEGDEDGLGDGSSVKGGQGVVEPADD